jgi:hypothetical protein
MIVYFLRSWGSSNESEQGLGKIQLAIWVFVGEDYVWTFCCENANKQT